MASDQEGDALLFADARGRVFPPSRGLPCYGRAFRLARCAGALTRMADAWLKLATENTNVRGQCGKLKIQVLMLCLSLAKFACLDRVFALWVGLASDDVVQSALRLR
jgi:hypothetical protein